jgi:hypothetical protein
MQEWTRQRSKMNPIEVLPGIYGDQRERRRDFVMDAGEL